MHKDILIDEHKGSDIIKACKKFLLNREKLKLYIVEFEENSVIKNKIYLSDYIIHNNNYCLIIVTTHDEYIFSVNDRI